MKKKHKAEIVKLLVDLGFVCKPWQTYNDVWWFNNRPLLSLSAIKKPSDIVNVCLVSFTPEALAHSDITESDRKDAALESLFKVS